MQHKPGLLLNFSFPSVFYYSSTAVFPYRNDKAVTTLSQPCHNLDTRLPQCFFTTLAQPCILKLLQGGGKVVTRLYEHCL